MSLVTHISKVVGKRVGQIRMPTIWRSVLLGSTLCGVLAMLVFVVGCPPIADSCIDNAGCEDLNTCTMDICDVAAGTCANTAITGCCRVDADCAGEKSCADNICVTTCMMDGECDDSDVCTEDACTAGVCTNIAISCDDSDMCTLDSCDPFTGCVNTMVSCTGFCDSGICIEFCTSDADCDDMMFCTGVETCDLESGVCIAGTFPCAGNGGCQANEICNETLEMCFALSEQLLLLVLLPKSC